jgi:hypothetical protein
VVAVIDRARAELGYAPTVPLEEGIARYLDWLRPVLRAEGVVAQEHLPGAATGAQP